MIRILSLITIFTFSAIFCSANSLTGKIYDSTTNEELVGVSVSSTQNVNISIFSGLDGSYNLDGLKPGKYTLTLNLIGYQTKYQEVTVSENGIQKLNIKMEASDYTLDEVELVVSNKDSDVGVRSIEKSSGSVLNIVSAKTIELSPDITVANVIQRVSGVTIERNNSGDGQYAILRGMDKRYNYTLVNGIKIPSPDNKNRFVPLDIFPAELLDRLEVTKSLTADMEGDGVGGAVNMVMKDAPNSFQFKFNIATGYNTLFVNHDFQTYDASKILAASPFETNGEGYPAKAKDFTNNSVDIYSKKPSPNLLGGFAIGNRFLHKKLGIILAGSYQNTYKGNNSIFFSTSDNSNLPELTNYRTRFSSEQNTRYGLHGKTDYLINRRHKLEWYNAYMNLSSVRVREEKSVDLGVGYNPAEGDYNISYNMRTRYNKQQIFSSSLHGEHSFFKSKFKIDWNGVYSNANSNTPDYTTINTSSNVRDGEEKFIAVNTLNGENRRWEHNDDRDYSGHIKSTIKPIKSIEVSFGGLMRDKQRSNFFNEYTLTPFSTSTNSNNLIKGIDWEKYTDITFLVKNPYGSIGDALNYNASEVISAGFIQFQYKKDKWQTIAGVRLEHTNQGFTLLHPTEGSDSTGNQVYNDYLPSFQLKYSPWNNHFIKASYFRAINRPSFFEIVPYNVVNEDYTEKGNPNLKHTVVDNLDLRYEFFPKATEQFMAGLFYKKLKDPIEYGMITQGQSSYFSPENFGTAHNFGVEIDIIKYFRQFGFKANYTYTYSEMITSKMFNYIDESSGTPITLTKNVNQTRSLYGQSPHVANLSIIYKSTKNRWSAQLVGSYSGERIYSISRYLDNDIWQNESFQLDASVEKSWKMGLSLFAKTNNLLNSPMELYLKQKNPANNDIPELEACNGGTLVRRDYYGVQFQIGARFKFE